MGGRNVDTMRACCNSCSDADKMMLLTRQNPPMAHQGSTLLCWMCTHGPVLLADWLSLLAAYFNHTLDSCAIRASVMHSTADA